MTSGNIEMDSSEMSTPLVSEMACLAFGDRCGLSCRQVDAMNWCGRTKTSAVASRTAEAMSGSATTFSGSLMPGKYLTLTCCSLMISLSGRPSTCSSCVNIRIVGSKRDACWRTLVPAI